MKHPPVVVVERFSSIRNPLWESHWEMKHPPVSVGKRFCWWSRDFEESGRFIKRPLLERNLRCTNRDQLQKRNIDHGVIDPIPFAMRLILIIWSWSWSWWSWWSWWQWSWWWRWWIRWSRVRLMAGRMQWMIPRCGRRPAAADSDALQVLGCIASVGWIPWNAFR